MNTLQRLCLLSGLLLGCPHVAAEQGQWETIFNGKDLSGWTPKVKGYSAGEDPLGTFVAQDGVLKVDYRHYDQFDNAFGHLFYHKKLSHYRLRLEYRFVGQQMSGAPDWAYKNSGVMLHSQSPDSMELKQAFPVSIEAQFLGADEGQGHRPTANLCTPGTVASIEGEQITVHCTESNSRSYTGKQWIKAELVVQGARSVEHWINGEQVYQYEDLKLDPSDPLGQKMIEQGHPLSLSSGYISLQSESHPIEFRSIELLITE